MDYEFETLLVTVSDGVAVITLNRPDRMNAFTPEMAKELIAAFDKTDADDAVKAIVLTGAGDRAFCAGADLGGGGKTFDYDKYEGDDDLPQVNGIYRDIGGLVTLRMFDSLKPIIGAINGAAAGIGATMTLAMDVRIASNKARFGFVFVRRGIAPDGAASWFLPRIVGIGTALSWTLSGRLVAADEALLRGLVESIHEPGDTLGAALAVARDIAGNAAPVSAAVTRRLMWDMLGAAHPMDAHRADSRAIQARGMSADAREGVAAFLEKRTPAYPDKVSAGLPDMYPGRQARDFA